MTAIDTVLLKVASRCNLDCSYCYVYRMGDEGWRTQPKRMEPSVTIAVAERLAALAAAQARGFSVVFHGGEPLLIGALRFLELCRVLKKALPFDSALHLQTNGVLLTDEILSICAEYEVGISVSIDGPAAVHDRHRPDRRGGASHGRVTAAIDRLRAHPAGASLFTGVLAVVDLQANPASVYAFLKSIGAPSIDFLYRDGHHDVLPVGKASLLSTEYGEWMSQLLDVYLADPKPTRIRVLDDMLKLLLGGKGEKEGIGLNSYGILVIDTDGSVNKNDTLKSARSGDRFQTSWSVLTHDLSEVVSSREFAAYHHAQLPVAPACLACSDLRVCGGGMPAHRWSASNGFANSSVFCADQRYLIDSMRAHLARRGIAA
ncbi:cyclophane-forming radical SAM/SPASM peptide maturase YhhB [Methylobacterium iners]|uniref:Anaerobic sulfatase-maturating enzyme n=1 Tax=Methylobacterium iners TaxID=418707 RepID=A0ABQ4S3H6_9HYPH|nr:cyclophane-forming radical SAM/SPASM peptide maturase YhhB [Methylobacterium iners]GJD97685.1 Anaerobic sulfatase-maturating enzyme [Methylobacterium iners]